MINSFANTATEKVWNRERVARFSNELQRAAQKKLGYLFMAKSINDLRNIPGNRFEALKGDRKGQYSIRINQQWRICFTWENGGASNVEITDYH